ncbi:pentatricopeptide repeat-containing protein At2g33680-like [Nymphaea colorata]|uniref:Pentacotripeptide-repeat region of PRORP domain-containing protein n=1 Tax=Nymphaea colorata TaxID=210225 RepID=A0A5K1FQY1_9MAGN|nr:pentatricopeptide repeat-containing protein At2g33680-like [Nymphaea colorata]
MHHLSSLLQRCVSAKSLCNSKALHAHLLTTGILADIYFQTKLLLAYAKCGDLHTASHLFDAINPKNDVAWNAILAGFSQHGHHQETLDAFSVMYKSAVAPDSYSFAGALVASAALKQLVFGRQTHACIAKSGWGSSVFVATALVDMYGKCSSVADSRKVFDEMPQRNAVTWNAMICACCAEEPDCQEGLVLFRQMVWTSGLAPDRFTLAAVLRLCSSTAAMEQGKQVHGHAIKRSLEDVFVQSCLVEMYSKCGFIEIARRVFERSKNRGDLVLWTAMISGYGKHGKSEQVVELFDRMLSEGIKPDDVTFVVVLSACSHQGLVNKGCNYFRSMVIHHGIQPKEEHYACLMDLLGRAGKLEEAWDLVKEIPTNAVSPSLWGALLGACSNLANLELGKQAAERVFELDPQNARSYVVLSNLYASVGRWEEIEELRQKMNARGVKKEAGCSWIEMK